MKWKVWVFVLVVAAFAASALFAAEATGEARKKAEALFERYATLERQFDPAIAELYADQARIEHRLINPPNPPEVRKYPAAQYKEQLRRVMPLAKRLNDVSYYTAITYSREGSRVRIRSSRYAKLKNFVSPMELLVGPDATGHWLIYEELAEARP